MVMGQGGGSGGYYWKDVVIKWPTEETQRLHSAISAAHRHPLCSLRTFVM